MWLGRKHKAAPSVSASAPRGIRYTSVYCLGLSRIIWEWAVASLPLDLGVAYLREPPAPGALIGQQDLLALLLLLASAGLLREQLFALVERLRGLQRKMTSRHIVLLLIGLAIVGLADVLARVLSSKLSAPLLVLIGVGAVAALSALRAARDMKKRGDIFLKDRFAQVEQANQLHFGLVIGPFAAARAVGLITAIYAEDLLTVACGTLGAAALLLALFPRADDFMAPCPRCCRMTSRVVKSDGCCPQCSPEKFLHRPQS